MATLVITYRIDSSLDYGARYASLVEQIRKCERHWEETTSFALVSTPETASQLADRLYFKSKIDTSRDTFMVINLSTGDAVIRGPVLYPHTLKGMLPKLVQK
ncbi:hypothetical protein [Allosphingosinicella sp.]|uniref:hypothetical protein n=1 Tax=Allosphingosinicella sp. TaxID=2823234 RepID=UPI002FC1BFC2